MRISFASLRTRVALVLMLLGLADPGRAQDACMLIPAPLAERVATASLIVEAGVRAQQAVSENGHIYTISELTVYKVFQGTEPAVLRLAEAGGTVGLRREVVSISITLAPEQQGLFLLEPHPLLPGVYRLVAGPQGFVRYDLIDRTASEPFGRYASIAGTLYPAVEALAGQSWRTVRPNAALAEALSVARPTAQPVISSFSPASLTAGTDAVLTINGSNFGATQGSGSIEFPNANSGGSSFVAANPADYVMLQWSDTQIQVRVPSTNVATGGVAGTGTFRVINSGGETGISLTALTVVYALSNLGQGATNPPNRPRLVNDDGQGGYTLLYSVGFAGVTGAATSFERALASWACATRLRRVVGPGAGANTTALNSENIVRFESLGSNTLATATSHYLGCSVNGGPTQFSLVETDYTFNDLSAIAGFSWNYGTGTPSNTQYDFESVALHELGHGTQLNHIIAPTAVMHFSISNGQSKRVLSAMSDIAAGKDVFDFSATNPCPTPLPPTAALVPTGCGPLPVELTAFSARYATGAGPAGIPHRWRWGLRSAGFRGWCRRIIACPGSQSRFARAARRGRFHCRGCRCRESGPTGAGRGPPAASPKSFCPSPRGPRRQWFRRAWW